MFRIEAIGNIGADAEIRDANGSKFISFRIAHSEKWEDQNGKKNERTQWIDVVISNAESKLLPYLKQGVKVFVRGHASLRVYSSPKERMMVAGIQCNAQEIELCGGIADEVPREVINPETSEVYQTQRFYWSAQGHEKMKKGETRDLIDKKGNPYVMDAQGFISPVKPAEEQPTEDNKAEK